MGAAKLRKIKDAVLGKRYELSVAFLSAAQMRKVVWRTKKKRHTSNVLAFPLSKTSGEVLICKAAAKPFSSDYLLIHALLHLKGYKHGARMDSEECRILRTFGLNIHEHPYYRNRRRHTPR